MKQLLSLVLATALIMSMASTVLAANSTTPNPVSGVSNKGFLKVDDENYIDLSDPADIATYGETIYFPLLKSGGSNTSAVNTFTTTYNNFYNTRNNSTYTKVPTAAIEAAIAGDTSYYATSAGVDNDKKAEYEAAKNAMNDTNNYDNGSAGNSDSDVYNGNNSDLSGKTRGDVAAIVNQGERYYTVTVKTVDDDKKLVHDAAQALTDSDYDDSGRVESGPLAGKTKDEVNDIKSRGESYYTNTEEKIDQPKKVVFDAAQAAINQNQFTRSQGNLTDSSTYKGSGLMNGRTYGYIKNIANQGESYYQTASGEDSTKKSNYDLARNLIKTDVYSSLNSAVNSFNSTYKTNYTIFTSLSSFTSTLSSSSSEGYVYYADRNMANNMNVSKISYEEGKSYISGLSVTAVRTSGGDRVYCVAVDVKNNTSSSTHDVFVNFRLNQKADSNYAKIELDCDLAFEVGFSTAGGDYDGEIPKNPATFRDGYGFDEDSEFEFTFEASSDLRYVVNTSGQGRIVLGLNTEFNEDVADAYPNANLDFYNGNYATFNRSGTLYIENDDDDLYIYSLSSSDVLSKVNCKYDSYENAYVITTRTLGVYIISDKKLDLSLYNTGYTESSSSSSSSGSGSGTGTGTGTGSGGTSTVTTPPASSTPSYNYNPPASSTAPAPAPSSSTPPSSSEPEDEEEPEEQEDPEEEEDPDEEDNDIVSVVTDDEENEGPDKKSGISGWVWALIVAALAAVPVAIGVIYYLKGKPRTKDFFLDDGEGGDFEDFDDDSSDFSDDDDFTR